MLLGTLNIEENLGRELAKDYSMHPMKGDELPKIDALFIDWIPRSKKKSPSVVLQATVVDWYVKRKVPTIIFDRFLGVTNKEYKWLRKFKTYFFEPAINHRRKFDYLPIWTPEIYNMSTYPNIKIYPREVDLGCVDYLKNKLKSFEKYYVEFAKLYPKHHVAYTHKLPKEKEEEYNDANIHYRNFAPDNLKFFILIGTQKAYDMGYLYPYLFWYMERGCIPLLPTEHKYFHSIFSECVIEKMGDISYIMGGYDRLAVPILVDIYERVGKYFPEMKMNHTVDVIKRCLE
jgi:hypothetical protein